MLDGAHLIKLLIACRRLGIPVVIPSVVLDELKWNHKQGIEKAISEIDLQKAKLAKRGVKKVFPNVDIDEECAAYAIHLDNVIEENSILIKEYPNVSAQELVTAAYDNKKPFKDSGEGHKDYLIFKTVVDLIEEHNDDIIFVTANHKDFCAKDKGLHPDLSSQVPEGHSVTVTPSPFHFYKDSLAGELEKLGSPKDPEKIVASIRDGSFIGFNLTDDLENVLIEQVCEEGPDLDEISAPLNDTHATQLGVLEVGEIEVSTLDDDLLNIDVYGRLDVELHGFMDKSDYYSAQDFEIEGVYVDDGDWNDWVVSAYVSKEPRFFLSVVFNQKNESIQSASVELSLDDQEF
jgi:hypothetical protein